MKESKVFAGLYAGLMVAVAIAGLIAGQVAFAAGSSVTQAVDINYQLGSVGFKTVTFTWTADDTDGSVPATAMTAATLAEIDGMFLYFVETDPGATAPTADYDITLTDASGLDVVGGALADRSATVTQRVRPLEGSNEYSIPVDGALTFTLTNNSVNDAVGTCKLYFTREP